MRDLNKPEPESSMSPGMTQVVADLLRTEEGQRKLCASLVQPARLRVQTRSGWLNRFNMLTKRPNTDPTCTCTSSWRMTPADRLDAQIGRLTGRWEQLTVTVTSILDHALRPLIVPEPLAPVPLTRETWEEAKADQTWAILGPDTYTNLMRQPWFVKGWEPSHNRQFTSFGFFGAHISANNGSPDNSVDLRIIHGLDSVVFGGPSGIGEGGYVQVEVTTHPDGEDLIWNETLKVHVNIPEPRTYRVVAFHG